MDHLVLKAEKLLLNLWNCMVCLQIAIMGCIVNGPGEMADADFGYVGGAPGKIDLYVGKV
jgi:4-hydroxy-3-methylbut-2-en-1-yl diphosphate synthase IspG/GcpE